MFRGSMSNNCKIFPIASRQGPEDTRQVVTEVLDLAISAFEFDAKETFALGGSLNSVGEIMACSGVDAYSSCRQTLQCLINSF